MGMHDYELLIRMQLKIESRIQAGPQGLADPLLKVLLKYFALPSSGILFCLRESITFERLSPLQI